MTSDMDWLDLPGAGGLGTPATIDRRAWCAYHA